MALCLLVGIACIVFAASPTNTFNPFCTYDLSYRFTATIEVADQRYSSEVVHQMARSRDWIRGINQAGCTSQHGTALPLRLNDDRVVLLRARICPAAIDAMTGINPRERGMKKPDYAGAMREQRVVNVADHCVGIAQNAISHAYVKLTDGFLIDSAKAPSLWEGFFLDRATPSSSTNIHLVSARAQAVNAHPSDDMDSSMPSILRTGFATGQSDWWNSPEAILSFQRRYRGKSFNFQARERPK